MTYGDFVDDIDNWFGGVNWVGRWFDSLEENSEGVFQGFSKTLFLENGAVNVQKWPIG